MIRTLSLEETIEATFYDVPPTAYYYEAVGIARKLGIVRGSGDNLFNPNESITREDMLVMLARALRVTEKLGKTDAEAARILYQIYYK